MDRVTVDRRFVVNLQGKDFVTYEGLLDTAHQKGLVGIHTDIIQLPASQNGNMCVVKAVAKTESGEFHGIGDADPNNVNRLITKHIIRMAETRAKARALRDLTNIGMTAIEELGGDDAPAPRNQEVKKTITKAQAKKMVALAQNNTELVKQILEPYGYTQFGQILVENYQSICDEIEAEMKRMAP